MKKLLPLALLVVLGCGCGGPMGPADDADAPDGGGALDADSGGDGGAPDAAELAPDAAVGFGQNHPCDLFVDDQCAEGLTCRLVDTSGSGACRPVGVVAEGDACASLSVFTYDQTCGQNMVCYNGPSGACLVLCDLTDPLARCSPQQSCDPVLDNVGLCN